MAGRKQESEVSSEDRLFNRRLTTIIIAVVGTILLMLLLWFAAEVFLLLFAGILFGIFLRGLARFVSEKSGLSINWSLPIIFVGLTAIVVVSLLLLAPQVSEQVAMLSATLPKSISNLEEVVGKTEWGSWLLRQIPKNSSALTPDKFVSGAAGFFSSTLGALANVVFVFIIGIYLALKPEHYRKGLVALFPLKVRPRVREVVKEVTYTLQWWMVGQISAMLVVGILTTIGLALLGIPLAITLGLLAAILAFIPNFGPIISVIPSALLGLMISPAHMVYVLLLYFGIQTIESYLITPQIHRKTIALPPVLTLIMQILFGILFGFPGLILATPLTALLLVLVKMVYVEDVLGDHVELATDAHSGE